MAQGMYSYDGQPQDFKGWPSILPKKVGDLRDLTREDKWREIDLCANVTNLGYGPANWNDKEVLGFYYQASEGAAGQVAERVGLACLRLGDLLYFSPESCPPDRVLPKDPKPTQEVVVEEKEDDDKKEVEVTVKVKVGSTSESRLRSRLIRLAYTNERVRPHLLPLLKQGASKSLKGTGLYLRGGPGQYRFTLYSVQALNALIEQGEDAFWDDFEDIVLGFITFQKGSDSCGNVYEMKRVAAQKGYGPVLYDLALSMAKRDGKDGVVPDRHDVSDAAARVWAYYYNRRKGDVTTSRIPEGSRCLHKYKGNDYLDLVYSIKSPLKISAARAQYHRDEGRLTDDLGILSSEELSTMFWEAGESFFLDRFGG